MNQIAADVLRALGDDTQRESRHRATASTEDSCSSIASRRGVKRPQMVTDDLLSAILDSALDVILIVDQEGLVTFANRQVNQLTGFDPEDIVGKPVFRLIEEDEIDHARERWAAIRSGDAQEFETELRSFNGQQSPCLISASPILGADLYLFVVRDLTDAKAMQAQLLQAEKSAALGRLVAGAAHELNNPLTAVLGFAQILREETDDEDLQEDLDRIIRGALRARRIVQDLLTFARQQIPVRSDTAVNETLQESLESVSRRARRSRVTIEADLDETLPTLLANAHHLKLVWDNIMTNACQAMAPQGGGELQVSSERIGDFVRISFSDTGPGIPSAHISRIFDPFFTTKGVGEGVGLGLSLCQGIIESHGGQLWVESAEGEGATFIADLPISAESVELDS